MNILALVGMIRSGSLPTSVICGVVKGGLTHVYKSDNAVSLITPETLQALGYLNLPEHVISALTELALIHLPTRSILSSEDWVRGVMEDDRFRLVLATIDPSVIDATVTPAETPLKLVRN